MDHQRMERKVSEILEHKLSSEVMLSDADGRTPAYTVTRLRQGNGSITKTDSPAHLDNGCLCGTQVGNEPSERCAAVFAGCS
jgi:hypothetical protein